jgi:hypothetical protein
MTCAAEGITLVELVFDAAGGDIAREPREPCALGGVGVRVAPGAYTVHVRSVASDGTTVGETEPESFEVAPGTRVTLNGGAPLELP